MYFNRPLYLDYTFFFDFFFHPYSDTSNTNNMYSKKLPVLKRNKNCLSRKLKKIKKEKENDMKHSVKMLRFVFKIE